MSQLPRALLALMVCLGLATAMVRATTVVVFNDNCNTSAGAESVLTQSSHTTSTGTSPFFAEVVDEGTTDLQAVVADYCDITAGVSSGVVAWTLVPNGLASADYDVLLTFNAVVNGQTDNDPFGIGLRYTDTSHFYAFAIDADTAPVEWRLIKRNGTAISAGDATVIDSGTATFIATDVIKISARGDTLKVFQNSTELGCVVDADLGSQGSPVLLWGDFVVGASTADASQTWRLDDIKAQTDDTLTDDNCGAAAGPPSGSLGTLGVGK